MSPIHLDDLVIFDSMMTRAMALNGMDRKNGTVRTRFSLVFITGDKLKWAAKQKLLSQAESLSGKEKEDLIIKANAIIAGGKLIYGKDCANSAARGMHAKGEKELVVADPKRAPMHYRNRTKNIAFTKANEVRKMHCGLLFRYNNEKLLY